MPTLRDLIDEEFGVNTVEREQGNDPSLDTDDAIVLRADSQRVGYIIVNTGSVQALMRYNSAPTATIFMPIAPNGGTMVSKWRDDLHLLGRELHGLVTAGTTTLHIVEIIIEPERNGE